MAHPPADISTQQTVSEHAARHAAKRKTPFVKHAADTSAKTGSKREVVYVFKRSSYSAVVERRSSPPSKKKNNKPEERPPETMAEADVDLKRQRLIALLTRAPQHTVRKILPIVEAELTRGQPKPPCAKHVVIPMVYGRAFGSVGKQCTERRLVNGKLELPKLPPGLKWPRKKYEVAHRREGISICDFLRAEWKPLIEAGYGELRWLRRRDISAARAIDKYERANSKTKQRRRLPEDLHFLRESEATNLRAANGVDGRDARLLSALAGRARRGKPVELS
jgi:hypothetical protein